MIVVGDIHGCFKTLMALVKKMPDKQLIAVGDLIDRGPQSKDVVDFFIKNDHYSVMGNHEDMATDYLVKNDLWIYNGGGYTLKSYKDSSGMIDKSFNNHINWMSELPLIIEYKNFIISHSAVFHCWDIDQQSSKFIDNSLWCRGYSEFVNKLPDGKVNIFGHTPLRKVEMEDHYINIDGGCVFKDTLVAYDMDTGVFYRQKNIED